MPRKREIHLAILQWIKESNTVTRLTNVSSHHIQNEFVEWFTNRFYLINPESASRAWRRIRNRCDLLDCKFLKKTKSGEKWFSIIKVRENEKDAWTVLSGQMQLPFTKEP